MGYRKEERSEYIELRNTIQERLEEKNTDIFRAITRIAPITQILCEKSTGTIFLNRKDFKKVYPALLSEEFKKSKVNLIVSADVLSYEKEEQTNPFSSFLGDKFIHLQPEEEPSLSKIQPQSKIFVAHPNVQCDSFMIFNNRSYILKIEHVDDPYFSCSLNAPYKKDLSQRLDLLSQAMQKIKTLSVPFQTLKQNVAHQKRSNRFDNGRQYE